MNFLADLNSWQYVLFMISAFVSGCVALWGLLSILKEEHFAERLLTAIEIWHYNVNERCFYDWMDEEKIMSNEEECGLYEEKKHERNNI